LLKLLRLTPLPPPTLLLLLRPKLLRLLTLLLLRPLLLRLLKLRLLLTNLTTLTGFKTEGSPQRAALLLFGSLLF
ncbi:MAG: hypothetical protein ACK41P_08585, partial [Asticcacaulis sp.]